MGKYELQCKIRDAEAEIDKLEQENIKLCKLKVFLQEKNTSIGKNKDLAEDYYQIKVRKKTAITGTKGRANSTLVDKFSDIFSGDNIATDVQRYESALQIIANNKTKAQEKIDANNSRIAGLKSDISRWESEIRDIERREEQERREREEAERTCKAGTA